MKVLEVWVRACCVLSQLYVSYITVITVIYFSYHFRYALVKPAAAGGHLACRFALASHSCIYIWQ